MPRPGSSSCVCAPVQSSGHSHQVQAAGWQVDLLSTALTEADVRLRRALLQLFLIGIHSPDLQSDIQLQLFASTHTSTLWALAQLRNHAAVTLEG